MKTIKLTLTNEEYILLKSMTYVQYMKTDDQEISNYLIQLVIFDHDNLADQNERGIDTDQYKRFEQAKEAITFDLKPKREKTKEMKSRLK